MNSSIGTIPKRTEYKGGGTYFHLGGQRHKKRHYNVKKGTNGAHADNITYVLMKHHCRHKVSFYMLSVVGFFFCWGELNKTSPPTKKEKGEGRALQAHGVLDAL